MRRHVARARRTSPVPPPTAARSSTTGAARAGSSPIRRYAHSRHSDSRALGLVVRSRERESNRVDAAPESQRDPACPLRRAPLRGPERAEEDHALPGWTFHRLFPRRHAHPFLDAVLRDAEVVERVFGADGRRDLVQLTRSHGARSTMAPPRLVAGRDEDRLHEEPARRRYHLYVMNADGTAVTQVTHGWAYSAAWGRHG